MSIFEAPGCDRIKNLVAMRQNLMLMEHKELRILPRQERAR
ncbi:hypothetical protein BOSE62_50219 [Bosea sp. 62]|nr:hypothetical protein BOSE46_100027 [Bosea sp. 46]CAD5256970.1 hypothetical protein BOSE21B_110027 [Bosea sp. 21B]VXB77706.1 hypothetical protein BOSE125_150141 [Bosea sp. 125]VXC61497.1 hypothetical protein BOSE62_50219 [Bosea sp. 62]